MILKREMMKEIRQIPTLKLSKTKSVRHGSNASIEAEQVHQVYPKAAGQSGCRCTITWHVTWKFRSMRDMLGQTKLYIVGDVVIFDLSIYLYMFVKIIN